ncbi:MAG: cereblon family protein [Pseudomonadota bacterium]|nr:hypothetical protein [Pseudomonadales bacterium]MDY6918738.1 cereblon family protein [Pseudomonadota bacterium]
MDYLDKKPPSPPPDTVERWLPDLADPLTDTQAGPEVIDGEPQVRCRACLNQLTSSSELIPVEGVCQHFFTNPEGIGFDLQTYLRVPGVELGGSPTEYFSWFPGFAWQHAFCRRCHGQMGWYFSCDGEAGFFGLITDRLLLD